MHSHRKQNPGLDPQTYGIARTAETAKAATPNVVNENSRNNKPKQWQLQQLHRRQKQPP